MASTPTPEAAPCDVCGQPLDGADRFCTHCGAPLAGLSPQALARRRARRWRRRRRALGVLVFVAAVGVLAVVVVQSVGDPGSDDEEAGVTSTTLPTTTTEPPAAGPYRVTDGLNVRSGPSRATSLVGTIEQGSEVFVFCVVDGEVISGPQGQTDKWLKVSNFGVTGYATAQYVATGPDVTSPSIIPPCPAL